MIQIVVSMIVVMDTKKVEKHYDKQADEHSFSPTSTMPDLFIRDLEISQILKSLKIVSTNKDSKILDIGCGNGYTTNHLNKKIKGNFFGIDLNKKMINVAKQNSPNIKFKVGSALDTKLKSNSFDVVYTERCLINILSWELQKKAIVEIYRLLKKDGVYVMLENFDDGLKNLNGARKAIGLNKINPAWHNLYFQKIKLKNFIKNKFIDFNSLSEKNLIFNNFLSTYYFGSRVLYPGFLKTDKIVYNNKFVEYFSYQSSVGNYSPIQVLMLRKK